MRKGLFFLILLLTFGVAVSAQEAWKQKNFDQWTKADVEEILNNSSWVSKQEVRLSREATTQSVAGAVLPGAVGLGDTMSIQQGAISPAVDFTFTLRLRSSMAIRLALIRRDQLETDLEKLTDKEFESYKAKQKGLYECPGCVENYVLTLSSSSRENKNFDAVYTTFSRALLDQIRKYIYLRNEKGEKRELVNFVPPKAPGDEAVFFFRRNDDKGNPLFTKDSKQIVFNTTNNEVSTAVNFKIAIRPIIIGDKVDF
jgi:plasmid maintenance system killer protein